MKKVLLLFRAQPASKPKAVNFAKRIDELVGDDIAITTAEIGELLFEVGTNSARITHPQQGSDIKDFDVVVIRHIGALDAEAHAVAAYCRKYGIKCVDSYLDRIIDDKLSAAFEHWLVGAHLPRTFYGPVDELASKVAELGEKAILKDNRGHKGKLNFVVTSADEVLKLARENEGVRFVLQEFIPNSGDYRVLVLSYKPVLVIKRTAGAGSHLNNTSQGGSAELVPIDQVDPKIVEMAVKVSRAEGLEVSGVDIIIDKNTGKFYILEVNHAPQISSGSFTEEKAVVYAKFVGELANG
jgi:glutathione synthase/RimK-type ligase-like ATP-grasp enzyme